MIYFNDASLHGQFPAFDPFCESLGTLWEIREILTEKGLQLRVCRSIRQRKVTSDQTFNDFLGHVPKEIKQRLLIWLDREGPFWDEERRHSEDEYYESCGEVVTDTGAAEAASLHAEGMPAWLFSLDPSIFLSDPLAVSWLGREEGDLCLDVPNGWNLTHGNRCASEFDTPFASWDELFEWTGRECPYLLLSPDIRNQLPTQFIPNVANRSRVLLDVLNKIIRYLKEGKDKEFQQLRTDWMQGENARFTPSSESEINSFKSDLTFRHPISNRNVLCSWHGKIKTPQFRIHFEWPLPEGEDKLFVAYIGTKITKR